MFNSQVLVFNCHRVLTLLYWSLFTPSLRANLSAGSQRTRAPVQAEKGEMMTVTLGIGLLCSFNSYNGKFFRHIFVICAHLSELCTGTGMTSPEHSTALLEGDHQNHS